MGIKKTILTSLVAGTIGFIAAKEMYTTKDYKVDVKSGEPVLVDKLTNSSYELTRIGNEVFLGDSNHNLNGFKYLTNMEMMKTGIIPTNNYQNAMSPMVQGTNLAVTGQSELEAMTNGVKKVSLSERFNSMTSAVKEKSLNAYEQTQQRFNDYRK